MSQASPPPSVVETFQQLRRNEPELAVAVAAIKSLTTVIQQSDATTMMGLEISLRAAADSLNDAYSHNAQGVPSISLSAACELFLRYVTRCFLEFDGFEKCKAQLIERGKEFEATSLKSRQRIANFGGPFIQNGMKILTHGASRVVGTLLIQASKTKHFSVIMTETRPSGSGYEAAKALAEAGIPTTLISDSAIGYAMEEADMVIVGAEGVVESGGIVNKIGTMTCAMVAKAMKTPFYVAAESYKFARLFPLNQRDFPESMRGSYSIPTCSCFPKREEVPNLIVENPTTGDYTPPEYITLLFTDLGVLTPSAVSDELIKLYQ